MINYTEMDEMSRDMLRELGNIGTGNAVTSLSQMMGLHLDITSPDLRIAQFQEIYAVLEESQELQAGILVEIQGELNGVFLFFLNEDFTKAVLDTMLGEEAVSYTHLTLPTKA